MSMARLPLVKSVVIEEDRLWRINIKEAVEIGEGIDLIKIEVCCGQAMHDSPVVRCRPREGEEIAVKFPTAGIDIPQCPNGRRNRECIDHNCQQN